MNFISIIGSLLAFLFGGLLLLDTKNSLLIISANGIEIRRSGYTIFAEWQNVEKVESRIRRRPEYVLVLQKTNASGNRLNKFLLGRAGADTALFLNIFEHNWHRKRIGNLIQYHAPHIKFPS